MTAPHLPNRGNPPHAVLISRDTYDELCAYMEDRLDVRDSRDGGTVPNDEMKMLNRLREDAGHYSVPLPSEAERLAHDSRGRLCRDVTPVANPHLLPKFQVLIRDFTMRPVATIYGDTEPGAWQGAVEVAQLVAAVRSMGVKLDRAQACVQIVLLVDDNG